MKNTLLLALLAAFSLLTCRQEPLPQDPPFVPIDYTVLPPVTQEGKNTFGCKVNGEVWVPRVELFVPWYDKAAQLNEKKFTGAGGITCRLLTENIDEWMSVTFGPTYFQAGIYHSSVIIGNPSSGAQFRSTGGRYSTDLRDSLDNWVNLSLIDTVRNVVSGTFNFVLYKNNNNVLNKNEKVILSEGRFDMPYYPN